MNNHPNILTVSFHTPPAVRPQSILIGKMIPEWIRQGLTPTIVSLAGTDWDIPLPRYRIQKLSIHQYWGKIPGLRRFFEKRYYERTAAWCHELCKRHNIDLIFSFANPQMSNILAATIKRKYGTRCVTHFSDPWYDNEYGTASARQARRILKQEQAVIAASDKVVFVSEQLKDLVMRKYPDQQAKAVVIPHCFDPALYPKARPEKKNQFVISHIGAFYEQRNPEILLRAIKKLIDQNPALAKIIKIKLVGGVNAYAGYTEAKIRSLLDQYGLRAITEILPTVSFAESLGLMKEADCLVVIDANFATSPFLPSKVIDYAGGGRPIVGITPAGSTTMEFLYKLGHAAFTYNEVDKIAGFIGQLIQGGTVRTNQPFLEQFAVKSTTARLLDMFCEVTRQS